MRSQSQSHVTTGGQSVSQHVLESSALRNLWANITLYLKVALLCLWVALSEFEVEINLLSTASRPVCLGVGLSSAALDHILFLSDDWGFLDVGAPSLTRGWACNLLVRLLLRLTSAVTLGSKPHRTQDHILLTHLRLPQLGGPGLRIYIPQEQGGPVIPPGTGLRPFWASPLAKQLQAG
jgi:hypothetical protein